MKQKINIIYPQSTIKGIRNISSKLKNLLLVAVDSFVVEQIENLLLILGKSFTLPKDKKRKRISQHSLDLSNAHVVVVTDQNYPVHLLVVEQEKLVKYQGDNLWLADFLEISVLPKIEEYLQTRGGICVDDESGLCMESSQHGFLTICDTDRNIYFHSLK